VPPTRAQQSKLEAGRRWRQGNLAPPPKPPCAGHGTSSGHRQTASRRPLWCGQRLHESHAHCLAARSSPAQPPCSPPMAVTMLAPPCSSLLPDGGRRCRGWSAGRIWAARWAPSGGWVGGAVVAEDHLEVAEASAGADGATQVVGKGVDVATGSAQRRRGCRRGGRRLHAGSLGKSTPRVEGKPP
jgi:hypothetical protein